jgi:hypothetical protein
MSRDNDTKKASGEKSLRLTISYIATVPDGMAAALARGDLSADVALPSCMMAYIVFSPPETTSELVQPLMAELCLLQLLEAESDGERPAQVLNRWSMLSAS